MVVRPRGASRNGAAPRVRRRLVGKQPPPRSTIDAHRIVDSRAALSQRERCVLLDQFALLARQAPDEGRPTRALRTFRTRLASLSKGPPAGNAAAATSLLLYTEALSAQGTSADNAIMLEGAATRRRLIQRLGRERWDEKRISAEELMGALEPPGTASLNARRLSLLSRLVNLASGRKHGPPSVELARLSSATVVALRNSANATQCCSVCLEDWREEDRVLVPYCGHAVHADCFWKALLFHQSDSYRGRCRTCRTPNGWGNLVRSNLRCMLASAAGAGLSRGGVWIRSDELADLCDSIAGEIGDNSSLETWTEVRKEMSRRGATPPRKLGDQVRRLLA